MKNKVYFRNYLNTIFSSGDKPLAKMLFTGKGYFLYDTGTNKILECNEDVFHLIQLLLIKDLDDAIDCFINRYSETKFIEVSQEVMDAINTEKILLAKKASQFGLSEHFHDIEKSLDSRMRSITLEVTEQCNLRCGYCLYNDHFDQQRNHSPKHMSLDIAYRAIRFLEKRICWEEPVAVGFYGGEPLLRFPFLKKCVQYTLEVLQEKKVNFNITTNATLIDEEIADFLIKKDFSVLVSLDGPEKIHNRFRKDKKGKGSFKSTLRGLRRLVEKRNKYGTGKIAINAVYTPPFSLEQINALHDFVAEQEWMSNIDVNVQYANSTSLKGLFDKKELKESTHLTHWAFNRYRESYHDSSSIVKEHLELQFAKFMQRGILSEPVDCYSLNGCCLPGQRKCFVTIDGSLQVCEKMLRNCPPIGHVETGFDFKTIKKVYIDDYAEKSLDTCSRCWGLRFCSTCYSHAFNEKGQLDLKQKHRHCYTTLKSLERSLCAFVSLLTQNPDKLDYLKQYEIR